MWVPWAAQRKVVGLEGINEIQYIIVLLRDDVYRSAAVQYSTSFLVGTRMYSGTHLIFGGGGALLGQLET